MEQTFGSFVREKRQSIGLSLRTLAAKLDLSPVYLSNIENDRRPAPTRAYLERLEQELHLSKVETEQMLDLAAKSQNTVASRRTVKSSSTAMRRKRPTTPRRSRTARIGRWQGSMPMRASPAPA